MSSSLLTLEELADYLKLSPEMILNQANQGSNLELAEISALLENDLRQQQLKRVRGLER
jgi:hypothetical protein